MREYLKIKEELKDNLSEERYKHTLYTQKEAVKLAKRYGEDINKTSIAALLHDCAKGMLKEDMIKLIENHRLRLDEIEKANPALLHAPAGRIIAHYHFKVTDENILNAIMYHTTGRENMSLLEKIIFIADIIEQTREDADVQIIREMAYENIDEAIIMQLSNIIKKIVTSEELLHINTIKARNYLIIKKQEKQRYINNFQEEEILEFENIKKEERPKKEPKQKKLRELEEYKEDV